MCDSSDITIWRQSKYNIKRVKKLFRKVQKLKHSTSKNPIKRVERARIIKEAYQAYIECAQSILLKITETIEILQEENRISEKELLEIIKYIKHGEKQIDLNRVGRGITPSPSHTTTHALARGGFSK